MGPGKQIPTRELRASEVPLVEPDQVDRTTSIGGQLGDLWTFALSFDGYAYFGGTDPAHDRLVQFAQSVSKEFRETGVLPKLGEIGMYRACLFAEQRRWAWMAYSDLAMADVQYYKALADEIRRRVH